MATVIGLRKATFTDLLLAVKTPKSSLNKNLAVLEGLGLIKQSRGFLFGVPGPRTFVEITPKGETGIKAHLEMIRKAADRILVARESPGSPGVSAPADQDRMTASTT